MSYFDGVHGPNEGWIEDSFEVELERISLNITKFVCFQGAELDKLNRNHMVEVDFSVFRCLWNVPIRIFPLLLNSLDFCVSDVLLKVFGIAPVVVVDRYFEARVDVARLRLFIPFGGPEQIFKFL